MIDNEGSRTDESSKNELHAPRPDPATSGESPRGRPQNPSTANVAIGALLIGLALGATMMTCVYKSSDRRAETASVPVPNVIEAPAPAPTPSPERQNDTRGDNQSDNQLDKQPLVLAPIPDVPPLAPPPPHKAKEPSHKARRVAAVPPTPRATCADSKSCAVDELHRCLAGDGAGCVGVGRYYEVARTDPFSAIKWYQKGCQLSNADACTSLEHVKGARPHEDRTSDDPVAVSGPVISAELDPAMKL